jgi:hypothetical protein
MTGERVSATTPEMSHRAGQGEGELAEERSGQPALQADGRIDRREGDGHGDDRPDQLARALDGRLEGVSPSRRWRSTFSTTTMASSTTSPTESTMASSVSRLTVNPKTCIRKTAPMSESGMATTGDQTERNEPRKRKMTTTTMSSVSPSVLSTSWMASSM